MKEKILAKVEECFLIAEKFYGKTFERPTNIIFKRCGTNGGHSSYAKRELMFQLDLAEHHKDDFLNRTVPHEVAHYVQRAVYGYRNSYGKVMPHGHEWKYIMRRVFGLNPDRCHKYDTSVTQTKKQTRHIYSCSCGKIFKISTTMHNKIQKALEVSKNTRYYDGNLQPYYKKPTYGKLCLRCRGTIFLKEEGNAAQQKMERLLNQLKAKALA